MAFKKITLVLFLANMFLFALSQGCGTLERNIAEKNRKYYVLDSGFSLSKVEEIMSNVEAKDTAFLRIVIENGQRNEDYGTFFKKRGIVVRIIGMSEYNNPLPQDPIILTKKENRIWEKWKEMNKKYDSLLIANKPTTRINRKMWKRKFARVHSKVLAFQHPFLFKMFPIYTYKNYTVIMYALYNKGHGLPFVYEICQAPISK
jgi:hypothetical protein